MKIQNKFIRYIIYALIAAVVAVALYFYLGFFGNPISKLLCKNTAEKYVAANYPECHVERWGYNFKDGNYFANIQKEGSPDTYFFVYTDWLGNLKYDSYESYVTSGHNTTNRMMMEYRAVLDSALPQESVDYTLDIFYGDILCNGSYEKYVWDENPEKIVAIPREDIVIDGQYDYSELGYKYGYICLYVNDEDVSVDRACEILLDVKEKLNKNGIGFYYIDFVLTLPRDADGTPNDDERRINIELFRWDDIYEEGLADRVQTAHDELTAYYAKMDAQKTAEMKAAEN
ncbi:MAG: hypothetical protein IJ410_08285 [Oscillospiraceae bacterium]|nr:hypothetical protein [Oscillospiraceae bacterium]